MSSLAFTVAAFILPGPPDGVEAVAPDDLWAYLGPRDRALIETWGAGGSGDAGLETLASSADSVEVRVAALGESGRRLEAADPLGAAAFYGRAAATHPSAYVQNRYAALQSRLLADAGRPDEALAAIRDLPDFGRDGLTAQRFADAVAERGVMLGSRGDREGVIALYENNTPPRRPEDPELGREYVRQVFLTLSFVDDDPADRTVHEFRKQVLREFGGYAGPGPIAEVAAAADRFGERRIARDLGALLLTHFPDSAAAPPQIARLRDDALAAGAADAAATFDRRLLDHPKTSEALRMEILRRTQRLRPTPDPAFSPADLD